VAVLTQATIYDPNRLLDFFTDPRITKSTLGKLLSARKAMLQPELLLRCLDTVQAEHRPLLLGWCIRSRPGRLCQRSSAARQVQMRLYVWAWSAR